MKVNSKTVLRASGQYIIGVTCFILLLSLFGYGEILGAVLIGLILIWMGSLGMVVSNIAENLQKITNVIAKDIKDKDKNDE